MKNFKLGIIGCGNMGSAILKGITAKGLLPPENIMVNDRDTDRMLTASSSAKCRYGDVPVLVSFADHIIIAVKPQDASVLLKEMAPLAGGKTVVSVMAGISAEKIKKMFGAADAVIVRAMPNIPALLQEGMTCVARNDSAKAMKDIKDIFSSVGKVIEIEEQLMDAATALSASGPAYLFYFAEALAAAGVKAGFDEKTAKELVAQTLLGASRMLSEGEASSVHELIKAVTSKGGTTEAALSVFKEKNLSHLVETAVLAAKSRSRELAEGA